MKETRMPPAYSANLVANSGNAIYGVSVNPTQRASNAENVPIWWRHLVADIGRVVLLYDGPNDSEYFCNKVNIWNDNSVQATAFIFEYR